MASADFPFALTKELSPGKALILSLRAVRLYLARLVWISGFAVAGTLTARTRPLCRFVFLRSKVCFPLPSAWPRGLRLTTSALRFPTVTSIGPDRIVSSCENQPMLGTLARAFSVPCRHSWRHVLLRVLGPHRVMTRRRGKARGRNPTATFSVARPAQETKSLRILSQTEVRDLYDRMAFSYDFWAAATESRAHQAALKFAAIQDGECVLEVGVGTGRLLSHVAARNPSGLNYGVDISRGMLARAARRSRSAPGRNLLGIASAYQLPFADESIDVVFGAYILDILPDESFSTVLTEWNRVTKPGGRLVLANMARGRRWYSRLWGGLYRLHPKIMGGCRPVGVAPYLPAGGWQLRQSREIIQATFPSEVILAIKPLVIH